MNLDVVSWKTSERFLSSSCDSGFIPWLNSSIIPPPSWTYLLLWLQKWPFVIVSVIFDIRAFSISLHLILIFLFAWPFKILCSLMLTSPMEVLHFHVGSLSSVYNLVGITYALLPHFFICLSGFCTDAVLTCDRFCCPQRRLPFYFWKVAPAVQLETLTFVC